MKKHFAILAIFAALCVNANASNPRRALVNTAWAAPVIMNVNEPAAVDSTSNYFLLVELGPGGQARAQYCLSYGRHGGAREIGPSFPLRYKLRKVHNDGSFDLKLKGEILDGGSTIYKTRPRNKMYTSSARVKRDTLECGFGTFMRIE